MAGTRNRLVRYTERMDGVPNTIAVFMFTNPFLYFGIAPIKLVVPTIKREYAVAITGSTENRYTKTGTVKIDPPPPIIPSETPINKEAKYPATSINMNISKYV